MFRDYVFMAKNPIRLAGKAVDAYLDNLEMRLFPNRCVTDVPQRPETISPYAWYRQSLEEVDLDWEIERKRGLFYYLEKDLPAISLDDYRPLRITFIQAGPAALELSDGSKFIPEELFSFVPSVLSSASSVLGAIQADAAMNFNLEHIHLKAHSDEFERLDESGILQIAQQNDVVLLGSQSTTWARCHEIIIKLRSHNPSLVLIAGGPQPTIDPNYVIDTGVDYVVRYDGCVSACGLIRAIAVGLADQELYKYLSQVPNLFYKSQNGAYQTTPRMAIVHEAGAPYPPVLSNNFYSRKFRENLRLLSTGASIGCPYKCAMCTSSRISSLSRRPVEHVIADFKRLYRMGELELDSEVDFKHLKQLFCVILGQVTHELLGKSSTQFFQREIFFWDDNLTFSQNKQYAMELFDAMAAFYKENNISPPFITLQVGIDFFEDEALIRKARKAGIRRVCCGFEHISDDALKQMEKKRVKYGNVKEQYRKAVALAHKNDIAVHGYLMVGFNETRSDIEDIVNFFRDISVCTVQVLFVAPWRKNWVAKDIEDVARQPQFDLDLLNSEGRIPNYLYDQNGELIQALFTGGLVPLSRAQNMDYKTLFILRRNIYKKFYTFESIIDVIKNRNLYPDWAYTAIIRYQTFSKYVRILDRFYKIYDLERKLENAEQAYQQFLDQQRRTRETVVEPGRAYVK